MNIVFLARSLEPGGAERQLVTLAKGLASRGHRVQIMTFYHGGGFENELEGSGVSLCPLFKKGRWDLFSFTKRLISSIKRKQPDIVHSYLTVPNLITILLKLFSIGPKIVWGIRASDMDLSKYDWTAKATWLLERRLSGFADLIVSNSVAGEKFAIDNGVAESSIVVIPNGIDTERFRPDTLARARVRESWKVGTLEKVIGTVGRLDPVKDYELFLHAVRKLVDRRKDVGFVCVGSGNDAYTQSLYHLCDQLKIAERVRWLGARSDTSELYNGFDLFASTSLSEGFPNVVAEAMATGLPCVATNVGDSETIVGDLGAIINSREPSHVADLWEKALVRPDLQKRDEIRKRIVKEFSVDNLIDRTEQQFWTLLNIE